MRNKYLWIFVIQFLSVLPVKGQEQQKDTISVPRLLQDKHDLHLQHSQSLLPFAIPGLWNSEESHHGISIEREIVGFNFNRDLKYLTNLEGDSSFLFLPVYPGLGDYQNFGGTLGGFNITSRLTLNYGAFISTQYGYFFSTKQIVLGSNFLFRYAVTNKLHFQTWGQYVTSGNSSDPTFNMRTFFPKTNFGSGLQYDSNEKTKINVGVEYQYDQSDKTWKPESGGKVQLKF
jgi:hypothetical protein